MHLRLLFAVMPPLLAVAAATAAEPSDGTAEYPSASVAKVRVAVTYPGSGDANASAEPAGANAATTTAPVVTIDEFPEEAIVSDGVVVMNGGRKVLATLYGTPVTGDEVLRELWERRGRETLEWMLGRELLRRELRRLRLEVTERDVDAGMKRHLEMLGKVYPHLKRPDALTRAASGMSADEYRERTVWTELALRGVMHETLEVRENDLRAYYASVQADFIRPERVRVSQVFIAPGSETNEDGIPDEEDWRRARLRIEEAHGRLRVGDDFADVARTYGSGGQLSRWVRRGELLRELEEAAFSIRAGSITSPIKTSMGYHVLTVEEKEERNVPDFETVRAEVQSRFEEERFIRLAGEFMARLREKALESGGLVLTGEEPFDEGD